VQSACTVPTISDRAWQAIAKYALEPAHEATFHARSYGFRPGRSAHDAQKILQINLNSKAKGYQKRVIELDIAKCFNRISHKSIMENLIAPSGLKLGIFRCLKSGTKVGFPDGAFRDCGRQRAADSSNRVRASARSNSIRVTAPQQGTPQGGVVSPLLANIALNGIEETHQSVRYADDMVYILKPNDNAEEILDKVKEFLAERGMEISEQKTKITATTDGFNFLGWNFKVQKNGKFRSRPSEDNYKAFRKKVKAIINCSNYGAMDKAKKLAPIVRGWRNYHRYCRMDRTRDSLYYTRKRAYKVFNKEKKQNRHTSKKLLDQAFPSVSYSENKFVNVKEDKSPYDGDLTYWSERNSKLYDDITSRVLKRQHHSCATCGQKLTSEERVHLHHVDGNHKNNRWQNLAAMHESCHDYLHMSKSKD
jgi:retron-type reverse transcriptase